MPLDLTDATIVFDLDGTLVDTAPDLAAATNHVLAWWGSRPCRRRAAAPVHQPRLARDDRAGLRFHDRTVTESELNRLHEQFLAFYADNMAVASRPFEGVPELLDELAAAGARLAVCTNKLERCRKLLLRQLDLDRRFAAIAGRDTFDVFKPAPGHLTRTIEMAGGRRGSGRDGG